MIQNSVFAIYQSTRILVISLYIVASVLLQIKTTALIKVICQSDNECFISLFLTKYSVLAPKQHTYKFPLSFSHRFKITKLQKITCIINKDLLLKLLHTLEAIHSRIFSHLYLPMQKKIRLLKFFYKNLQKHCSTLQNVNALLSSFLLSLIHLHEIIAG